MLRPLLRWTLPILLAVLQIATWTAFLGGGLRGAKAWAILLTLLPLTGALVLLGALGVLIVRRQVGGAWSAACLLATAAMLPGLWNFGVGQMRFPAKLDRSHPAATVRVPMDGVVTVAWGGDHLETNYHAFTPDQRWAYDLLVEPALIESDALAAYGCFGKPIFAPASGTITSVKDGMPDLLPGEPHSPKPPTGNHVVLRLAETGTYLVLAHLQQGSVTVAAGELVQEGQPLARCGNSGNTSEPHLHIHHQRQDPATMKPHLAEGLPLFFRDHQGPPMPVGGISEVDGAFVLTGDRIRHIGAEGSAPSGARDLRAR